MRNTIILGLLIAVCGFAAAQASDYSNSSDRDRAKITSENSTEGRSERRERHERAERVRERHDESRERHDSRDDDDSGDRKSRR